MRVPSDYRPPTDANLEAASRVGGAAPDTGSQPLVDVLTRDASHPLPDQRIPYFAWAGRIAIISGEAKAGKSTVIAQALCAAVNGNAFAATTVLPLTSVAIATDEPPEIVAARLRRYGLSSPVNDGVVYVCSPREGIPRILATVARLQAEVLIIDSLTAWAYHRGAESMNDPLAMCGIVTELRQLAETGVAVSIVHYGRKEDGELRDSVHLAAAADLLISFKGVAPDGKVVPFRTSNLRRLSAVGPWPVDTVVLGFRDSKYYVDRVGSV